MLLLKDMTCFTTEPGESPLFEARTWQKDFAQR